MSYVINTLELNHSPSTVFSIFEKELNKDWLKHKIVSIIKNEELLIKCHRNYLIHQNGFHKIILHESKKGWRLRLHIWDGEFESTNSFIHNHSSLFISKIFLGQLELSSYRLDNKGLEFEQFNFIFNRDSKTCSFNNLNKKDKLILFKKFIKKKGEIYSIDKEELHSVKHLKEEKSISLVYQASDERDYSILYGNSNSNFKDSLKPNISDLKKVLINTIQLLNKNA